MEVGEAMSIRQDCYSDSSDFRQIGIPRRGSTTSFILCHAPRKTGRALVYFNEHPPYSVSNSAL